MSGALVLGLALLAPLWLQQVIIGVNAQAATETVTLCEADDLYNSTVVPFDFNNNAWGDDGSGQSCMTVENGGESWSVTYNWGGNPALVKAFPRMKAHPSNLPVPFWNVSAVEFQAEWNTYVLGTENDTPEEQDRVATDIYLRSNVALDVFLSDDALNSTQVGPPIEIMIWFWRTPTIIPLGWTGTTEGADELEVDGMKFHLYNGFNAQGQHVFSWLAERNMTSANADYSPLFKHIWQQGYLSGALWLGQLEFGFEVMHAGAETRSEVARNYTMRIIRDGDPDDPALQSSSPSSTTTTVAATPTNTTNDSAAQGPTTAAVSKSSPKLSVGVYTGWVALASNWLIVSVLTTCTSLAYNSR